MIGSVTGLLFDAGSCCGPMGGWGWMGMTLGWVGVAGVLAFALRAWQRPSGASRSETAPLELLAARFAAGEISEEEYERRRSVLMDR